MGQFLLWLALLAERDPHFSHCLAIQLFSDMTPPEERAYFTAESHNRAGAENLSEVLALTHAWLQEIHSA
ncbi:MAG TPA: hypothetical protein VF209_00500 [Patescibacteria group bacterium]